MNPDALPGRGALALVTVDADTTVTEATGRFAELIGRDPGVDPADEPPVELADLLAPDAAAELVDWARTGHSPILSDGRLLLGRGRDGLPLVLLAYALPGEIAATTLSVLDHERPHRRLLLQRAGGPVVWAGSPPAPAPERTGTDHVLAHDVRGSVRTARTFMGVHQRRLREAADAASAAGGRLPEVIATDRSADTAVRALGRAEEELDALVRYERYGTDPLTVAPVPLADVVTSATARARTMCDALGALPDQQDLAGGLDVRRDLRTDLTLVADAEQLTWVLTELLVNARKFGRLPTDPPASPTITVSARRSGRWVDLLVASRGRVVPAALAEDGFSLGRMLQPRGERPGAGLGLSLCRRIVTRHAGRIRFLDEEAPPDAASDDVGEPEPGRGTTIVELRLLADSTLDDPDSGTARR